MRRFSSSLSILLVLQTTLFVPFHKCRGSIIARFVLDDNISANVELGNISEKSSAIPAPATSAGYHRTIMEPNRFADQLFRVNSRTSGLSTKVSLDRDDLCRDLECCARVQCSANFTVFISPTASKSYKVVVVVTFNDANDNSPVIDSRTISLPESTPVGSTKNLPVATDLDSLANGVKEYKLVDRSGTFSLVMTAGKRPALRVDKELDADDPARRTFQLSYSAIDGGEPAQTGQVMLEVRIEDENDNAPTFKVDSRVEVVKEDKGIGETIFRFEATDADYGPDNKRISYRLDTTMSTPPKIAGERFEVSRVSGAVTVRSKLDYDNPKERHFMLIIEAKDHGSPARSATATLSIKLQNVNDNDPKIKITNSEPLIEEKGPGQRVRTISVEDPDEISSINVNCSLTRSEGFEMKTITENHYFDIVTTKVFDHELTPKAGIIIQCTDWTPPARTVHESFEIVVVDVNDHSPQFTLKSYSKPLREDTPHGTEVLTVKASDRDSGLNGDIRYSVGQIGARFFKVDNRRGIVYTNATLDREAYPNIRFKIWASDSGSPPRRTSVPVQIDLTDVNDNAPSLVGPKTIDVVENAPVKFVAGKVRFKDPDEGRNGSVFFQLVRDNNIALKYFNMTADGQVVVVSEIDREQTPQLYLDIEAWDRGVPVQKVTAKVVIRILDLNDNTPHLDSPGNLTMLGFSPPLYADSPFNSTVTTLKSTDGDFLENGTISYEIFATNATGMFRIHPSKGRIYSAWRYPSQPGHGVYYIKVRLCDKGKPPKWSETTLMISVAPASGNLGALKSQGFSNVIILVLIIVCSVAISTALVIAILWARSRSKRPLTSNVANPEYDYDTAQRTRLPVTHTDLDSEVMSNAELVPGCTPTDPMVESGVHTLTRSHRSISRLSQAEYPNPYPLTATIRSNHNPLSFENFYTNQYRFISKA